MSVAESPTSTNDTATVEVDEDDQTGQPAELEVLVEEISIDGMCGVY